MDSAGRLPQHCPRYQGRHLNRVARSRIEDTERLITAVEQCR